MFALEVHLPELALDPDNWSTKLNQRERFCSRLTFRTVVLKAGAPAAGCCSVSLHISVHEPGMHFHI